MKKTFLFILCVLLLFSCEALPESAPSEEKPPPYTGEEGSLGLIVNGVCRYVVVRSETASDAVIGAARDLDTYFFYHLETHIEVKNDFKKEGALEILVGNTNRKESEAVLATLKEGEFAVCRVGEKLVLCGYDDEGTVKAVNRFLKEWVKSRKLEEDEIPQLIVKIEPFAPSPAEAKKSANSSLGGIV